jgi:hypothetical protein
MGVDRFVVDLAKTFLERPIEDDGSYIWIDAT